MDGDLQYLRASNFFEVLKGNIAFLKSDLNVPLSDNFSVSDIFKITQSAPFIKKLIKKGVIPLIATHLGRPKSYDPSSTLDIIIEPLSKAIDSPIEILRFDPELMTYPSLTREKIREIYESGKIPMLDNLRFHPHETKNKGGLAKIIAEVSDVSIQNSFGTAHRKEDTSNYIHQFIPGLAGDLLVDEIEAHRVIKKPSSLYAVIVGGDKVDDSLQLMRALFRAETTTHWSNLGNPTLNLDIGKNLVDYVLVGGHLMNAFVYAQLQMIGEDLLEKMPPKLRKELRGIRNLTLRGYNIHDEEKKEDIRLAKGLLRLYNNFQILDKDTLNNRRLIIPTDYTVRRESRLVNSVKLNELLDDDELVDIGIQTRELYTDVVKKAKTIVWNGPLGTNDVKYTNGTRKIIDTININKNAVKEIGGGSTNKVISDYQQELSQQLDVGFRSTGGGSTLLEVAYDSPTTISLMMSSRRLTMGRGAGYGLKYKVLRSQAIEKMKK